jgi:hypothetical protein
MYEISNGPLNDIIRVGHYQNNTFLLDKVITVSNFISKEEIKLESGSQEYRSKVLFKDCVFTKYFLFINFSNIGELEFDGCKFDDDVDILSAKNRVHIAKNCSFSKKTKISFAQGNLDISESSFFDLTLFGNIQKLSVNNTNTNVKIENTVLLIKDAAITYSEFNQINFTKIWIQDNSQLFYEGNFKHVECKEMSVKNMKIGHLFHLMNCTIKDFSIDNIGGDNKHRYLKFSEKCDLGRVSIPLHMFESVDVRNCNLSELNLTGKNNSESVFVITNCDLGKVNFTDVVNKGSLSLRDITLIPNGVIKIINSDLGKADFIACKFSDATMEFQSSKVMDIFLSETDFPDKVLKDSKPDHKQARLAFGQLHTAFQKQGDTIRSLEYHSREVEEHFKDIWKQPTEILTTLNLSFNAISNYFGRWWGLGVMFTFAIGFLFFSLLLVNTNRSDLWLRFLSKTEYLESFLKFMNPLRQFDIDSLFRKELFVKPISRWYYIFDFLGRLFIVYGYYQTIQAFRKFGRK